MDINQLNRETELIIHIRLALELIGLQRTTELFDNIREQYKLEQKRNIN